MNKGNYHKYVFDMQNRSFIGEFDQMYKAEKTESFDSWHQDDVNILDKQLCLQIIEQSNYYTIVDIGCGKGALTHLMKTKDNLVFGLDISQEAVSIASRRYNNIQFFMADIKHSNLTNILNKNLHNTDNEGVATVDCIVCLETLSYVENWKKLIRDFSALGKFALIKLYIPDDPIGYVKNGDEFVSEFNIHFNIVEHIKFVSRGIIILFGKSKLIGEV